MSRTVLPLLFLVFATVAATQVASDYTVRHGYPDTEQFVVRPGITMMPKCTEDRTACENVYRTRTFNPSTPSQKQFLATVTVSKVIDELLPANHDERSATLIRKNGLCRSGIVSQKYVPAIELDDVPHLQFRYAIPVWIDS